ncbi:phage tail length tape measure family protein [Shinella zoogloeoides]|uniref:phage tail length tape measure family protein n=1 Tax=Shinella zoogloeoides TaxID=352475 RepID=UPI00273F8C85|nr:phage tail length tape measure family protein [Shinella zoogloeoides]WLR92181.1 phage tail length tape measure family protein [Shinella zoogloeoides]
MAGQMSDLMFNIVAQDRTRAAFTAANSNADAFAKKGAAAAREASKGIDVARGSVANLAAQFSDIGVQLSGGQSPFLIALQQGSQIGQVLGPMGAAGAAQALGSAFLSLLSPVNLLTIGTIALGGAAFAYFSDLLSGGEDAEETLERQLDLVRQVASQWGEAVPALRDYVAALEQAERISQIIDANSAAASSQWAGLRGEVADLNVEFADAISQIMAFGGHDAEVSKLQAAFNDLASGIADGSATAQEAEAIQAALFALFETTGNSAVEGLMARFAALAEQIGNASAAASKFNLTGAFPSRGAYGNVERSADGPIQGASFLPSGAIPTPESRGTPELSGFPFERFGSGGGRRGGGKSEEERQAENIQRVIQSLEDEQVALGKSKTEQRIMQSLRRADVDATSAQGQQIAQLITQIENEKEALKLATDAGNFMRDALKESFSELIPEIETGNRALDSFINKLIQASAEAMFFGSGPMAGLFGTSGGGLLSGLFGGGRALGGAVDPWRDYLVGENGPEIVRIGSRGGRVGEANTGGAAGMVYAPVTHIDARGADQAAVMRIERAQAERDRTEARRFAGYQHMQSTRNVRP